MQKTIDSLRIGKNIKDLRLANEMTQVEMGELLGYSERQIRRLETNGTYDIGVINLIASTFNVSALNILSNDGMFWFLIEYKNQQDIPCPHTYNWHRIIMKV